METINRTKVYNVIILDKSGSMSSIARQAIDGVNETIASIKRSQETHPDQDNQLTLVAFCGCEIKKIYEQTPIGEVKPITNRDYMPCCMTPLYDAMGTTISTVHRLMESEKNAIASVTIITDGYENASKEYSHAALKSLIEAYKSEGWLFAYIGADHDVEAVSFSLSIDNSMAFEKTDAGTRDMFCNFMESRSSYVEDVADIISSEELEADEKRRILRKRSKSFFKRK
ncbi:MAG: VWA domain-containing protein [Muribaculaceae bacterium]|nr:VWA domain-containing protein [Muribaculaceae bacterium]MBR6431219.1 VWA domain-containing protein [Muribaculaceae bacterium]